MYSQNFVVAIIHNEQFCEESKDGVVTLPFGSEYKIRLRNKNNRPALAKVFIDEENVSSGGIVVSANNYVDIERSVDKALKFKFVSSSSGEAIDQGKNNKIDGSNGVIRVEWKLEKEYQPVNVLYNYTHPYYEPWKKYPHTYPNLCRSVSGSTNEYNHLQYSMGEFSKGSSEGCTVEGSHSNQSFTKTSFNAEETNPIVIRLVLKGYNPSLPEQYKKNLFCSNCGFKVGVTSANYCHNCGNKI